MNAKSILSLSTLAVALLGAGAAFAQEATSDAWTQTAVTKSRAQVSVELQQARANGSIAAVERGYIEPARSVASRAAVHADAVAALRNGESDVVANEAHAFAQPRNVAPATVLASK
jgi:hypothetical protein